MIFYYNNFNSRVRKIVDYVMVMLCPRSLNLLYIVSYYINWVKTSRTYSTNIMNLNIANDYIVYDIFMSLE